MNKSLEARIDEIEEGMNDAQSRGRELVDALRGIVLADDGKTIIRGEAKMRTARDRLREIAKGKNKVWTEYLLALAAVTLGEQPEPATPTEIHAAWSKPEEGTDEQPKQTN